MRERLQPFYRSVPSSALGTILTLGNETGTAPHTDAIDQTGTSGRERTLAPA